MRSSQETEKSLKDCAIACSSGENIIFANSNYIFSESFFLRMFELHEKYPHDLNIIFPNSENSMENESGMDNLLHSVYKQFHQREETLSFQWLYAMFGIFIFKKRYLMGRLAFSNEYINRLFQHIEMAFRIQNKGYKCRIFPDENSVLKYSIVQKADKLEDDFRKLLKNNFDFRLQLMVIIKEVLLEALKIGNNDISEVDIRKFIRFETALRCFLNKYITRDELLYIG